MKNIIEEAYERGFTEGTHYYSATGNGLICVVRGQLSLHNTFDSCELLLKSRCMGVICRIGKNNSVIWAEII